jgi:hypothetical protein
VFWTSVVQLAARGPHLAQDHMQPGPRNYLLSCCFIYFIYSEGFEKIVIISSAAIDFKTLPLNISLPAKTCVRYKLLQEKI